MCYWRYPITHFPRVSIFLKMIFSRNYKLSFINYKLKLSKKMCYLNIKKFSHFVKLILKMKICVIHPSSLTNRKFWQHYQGVGRQNLQNFQGKIFDRSLMFPNNPEKLGENFH